MALWPFAKKPPFNPDDKPLKPVPTMDADDLKRYLQQPVAREGDARPPIRPAAPTGFTSDAAMSQMHKIAPAPPQAPAKAARQAHAGGGAPAAAARAAALADPQMAAAYAHHNGANFLSPTDLAVNDIKLRRIAMIGSCFLNSLNLHKVNPANCPVDLYLANNVAKLEKWPATDDGSAPYDFQVIQLGLRFVLPDATFWRLPYDDITPYETALDKARRQIDFQLERRMGWNTEHGLLTFVANFMCPQRNPMGSLFARFDLRNPEFFVQKLNEHLEQAVARFTNAHVLDLDRISQSVGRRYSQDDATAVISHNALIGLRPENLNRIEPLPMMNEHFQVRWPKEFPGVVWNEMMSMYRIVRQADAVKLVVIDLDDTLWTGVIGEMAAPDPGIIAGWQVGFIESLMWLKKRGILLAILSKNEDSRIRDIWPHVFTNSLELSDFAAIRINWSPKVENMQEILADVNLLPRNVVFIDDNPAERTAMAQAFPDMRILGRYPYYLRSTLLWAPETQVAALTTESARRTEMIQAQLEREEHRRVYSTEDFLAAASPYVTLWQIGGVEHPRFARASELVNKTNQFNTTGRRWAPNDWTVFFRRGGKMHVFDVKDAYTAYGLVGVVLVQGTMIEQWVMSCRVLGYEIEDAVMVSLVAGLRAAGAGDITARLIATDANFPCRGLYAKAGFTQLGDVWSLDAHAVITAPLHVTIAIEE